jgi:hypothetical protein
MAIWLAREQRALPMFEIICLAYFAQYSLPVYLNANEIRLVIGTLTLSWEDTFQTLVLSSLGLALMLLGYYATFNGPFARSFPPINFRLEPVRTRRYIIISLIIGILFKLLAIIGVPLLSSPRLLGIINLLHDNANLSLVILAFFVYRSQNRSLPTLLMLWGITGVFFVYGVLTGLLWNAVQSPLMVLLIKWYMTRRVPWRSLIIFTILLMVLQDVKHEYRQQVWFSGQDYNLIEKLDLWVDLTNERIGEFVIGSHDSSADQSWKNTTSRLDMLRRFVYLYKVTPDTIPYWNGLSYEYLLYTWIPRVLWAEKPNPSAVVEYLDVTYFLKEQGSSATIGIGFLPEAYINFGTSGIIIVFLLQGGVFGLLGLMLNRSDNTVGQAIYLVMMFAFTIDIGFSAALAFGSVLQRAIVLTLVLRVFAGPPIFGHPPKPEPI